MKEYELYTLQNGIRVVHKQVTNTKIIHCGIMLDIGSRDERPHEQGMAHFWEHMAFKGTEKRNAFHIINSLESVGGELNAYTTKEKICFYASVIDNHFDKAIDLITDIAFRSTFPEKQIEKERSVILEEMAMYYDSPEDAIQDEFDELIFEGHQLGKNILGNAKSVKSFHKEDFQRFVNDNLNSDKIIFTSVGNVSFKKVLKLAQKHLDSIGRFKAMNKREEFEVYNPLSREIKRSLTQAQCAIGNTTYSIKDKRRLPFFMLLNILGGPGMNSRLNLTLREKFGMVYSIDASYTPYVDTGSMGIFFGTEPRQVKRGIQLVLKELQKLREVKLGTLQLHKAKEQLMGQLAMAEENNNSHMLMMAKSLLDLEKIRRIEEIFDEIKSVTSSDLVEIANESFEEKNLSILTFLSN
ncbi:MAG: pitrilysin family protein [Bacteroidetes bacterium]|nr:pitrilysin family protein [Bacteroidota bacterium]MDA1122322.1 pitrilysin family protein [Bacteroidota bacterium]